MFTTNQQISYLKTEQVSETAVNEDFGAWHVYPSNKQIIVEDHLYNSAGEIIKVLDIKIEGDNYDLLMSANPSFSPNKPANEFSPDDLKYVIDKIRSEQID